MNENDKAAIEREQSQTSLSYAEREQARPQVNENEYDFRALKARRGARACKFRDYNRALVLKHPRTITMTLTVDTRP